MTTVAVKDGIIACDGQASINNLIVNENFEKVSKFTSPEFGSVYIAFAGAVDHIVEAVQFIERIFEGIEPEGIKFDGTQMAMLMLTEDGDIFEGCLTERSTTISWVPCEQPYAIGSGSQIALGAMEAGASAERSVLIASRRDSFTNDNVTVYAADDLDYIHILKDQHERLTAEIEAYESAVSMDSEIVDESSDGCGLITFGENDDASEESLKVLNELRELWDKQIEIVIYNGEFWFSPTSEPPEPMMIEVLFDDGSGCVMNSEEVCWSMGVRPEWFRPLKTESLEDDPESTEVTSNEEGH